LIYIISTVIIGLIQDGQMFSWYKLKLTYLSAKSSLSKTFNQLYKRLIGLFRLICLFFGGGWISVFCTLFPSTMVLSHWVFLVIKIFNEAVQTQKILYFFFLSLEFFSIRFLFSKVLMRDILDGHPRKSVTNIIKLVMP
jgi:hypothetical protein